MRAVLVFALAAVLLFAGPSLDGGGTIQPLAVGRVIAASGGDNVPFVLPIGDVVHFVSPIGKDSANGRTPATAWATANHRVNCGDVIIAEPGIYGQLSGWGPVSKCPSISGGVDGTGGIYFAVLLCAGPNLGACNVSGGGTNNAIDVNRNNWAVEGFNASAPGTGQAFFADACNYVGCPSPRHVHQRRRHEFWLRIRRGPLRQQVWQRLCSIRRQHRPELQRLHGGCFVLRLGR